MVDSPRDCSLLQHLPDYNTWVNISNKTACCAGIPRYESGGVSGPEGVKPHATTGLKLIQFHIVVNGVVCSGNQLLQPPTSFSFVPCFKRRSVAVFGTTSLDDSTEAQFRLGLDGHGEVSIAPSGRKHRILRRAAQALDENHFVGFKQLIHSFAETNRENVLAVFRSQRSSDLAKDVRFFHQTLNTNFGPNHVAHGDNRDPRLTQHRRKFTLAGAGHAANRHNPSHDQTPVPNAQEHTPLRRRKTQFENSDLPHRLSINFQSNAEAKIKPTEMAIMPM